MSGRSPLPTQQTFVPPSTGKKLKSVMKDKHFLFVNKTNETLTVKYKSSQKDYDESFTLAAPGETKKIPIRSAKVPVTVTRKKNDVETIIRKGFVGDLMVVTIDQNKLDVLETLEPPSPARPPQVVTPTPAPSDTPTSTATGAAPSQPAKTGPPQLDWTKEDVAAFLSVHATLHVFASRFLHEHIDGEILLNSISDKHLTLLGFDAKHKAAFWKLIGVEPKPTNTTNASTNAKPATATVSPTVTATPATATVNSDPVVPTVAILEEPAAHETKPSAPADKASYLKARKAVGVSKLSLVANHLNRAQSSRNMPPVSDWLIILSASGFIGHAEMKQLVYDLGIYLTDEEIILVMSNIGKEAGKITFEELVDWWKTEKKFEKLASIQYGKMKETVEYFQQFDRDVDGKLNRSEFDLLHQHLIEYFILDAASNADQSWSEVSQGGFVNFNTFLQWLGLEHSEI